MLRYAVTLQVWTQLYTLLKKLTSNLTVNTLHLNYKDQLTIALIVTISYVGKLVCSGKVKVQFTL